VPLSFLLTMPESDSSVPFFLVFDDSGIGGIA
jgi:hypothetical protein